MTARTRTRTTSERPPRLVARVAVVALGCAAPRDGVVASEHTRPLLVPDRNALQLCHPLYVSTLHHPRQHAAPPTCHAKRMLAVGRYLRYAPRACVLRLWATGRGRARLPRAPAMVPCTPCREGVHTGVLEMRTYARTYCPSY